MTITITAMGALKVLGIAAGVVVLLAMGMVIGAAICAPRWPG